MAERSNIECFWDEFCDWAEDEGSRTREYPSTRKTGCLGFIAGVLLWMLQNKQNR